MTLDFSKLAPMTRSRLLGDLSRALAAEASRGESDLKAWSPEPSSARAEMEGWTKAARDLALAANEIRKK